MANVLAALDDRSARRSVSLLCLFLLDDTPFIVRFVGSLISAGGAQVRLEADDDNDDVKAEDRSRGGRGP